MNFLNNFNLSRNGNVQDLGSSEEDVGISGRINNLLTQPSKIRPNKPNDYNMVNTSMNLGRSLSPQALSSRLGAITPMDMTGR